MSILPFDILCVICNFHPTNAFFRISKLSCTNKILYDVMYIKTGRSFIANQEGEFRALHTVICQNNYNQISYTQYHNIVVITRSIKMLLHKTSKNCFYPVCPSINKIHQFYKQSKNRIYRHVIIMFLSKWYKLFSRIVKLNDLSVTSFNFDFGSKLYS